jgi:hypothetical protein
MRDLDDLLDPMVSRRASEAAHPPDFAAVERRGHQRQRRARVMALGAVVAVVAGIGVVGIHVASNRADPVPAERIEKFDDADGELAKAIEAGDAKPREKLVDRNGSVLLTTWEIPPPGGYDPRSSTGPVPEFGYTLRVDGQTLWSSLYDTGFLAPTAIGDDAFIIASVNGEDLVTARGIRPLTVSETPVDIGSSDADAFLSTVSGGGTSVLLAAPSAYLAIDLESATAAPVSELDGIDPGCGDPPVVRTDSGDVWALKRRDDVYELVRYGADGTTSSYRYARQAESTAAALVEHRGRVGVVWNALGRDRRVSVPGQSPGSISTYDYPDGGGRCLSPVVLPDGRLLIVGAEVIRSADASWQTAATHPLPSIFQGFVTWPIVPAGDEICTSTAAIEIGQTTVPEPMCTTDGLKWHPGQIGS